MRFHGAVGFEETVNAGRGVFIPKIVERTYYGDVIRWSSRRIAETQQQNDDIRMNNSISIIADAYASKNYHQIKFVVWDDVKWTVTSVTVGRPRLTLELGDVYSIQEVGDDDYEDDTESSASEDEG